MTEPASEDHQSQPRRLALHGRRTRLAVAVMGCLVSLGVPVTALSSPGLTVDQQTVRPPDDPAGLGITGALAGDPLPFDPTWETTAGADGLPTSEVPSVTPSESATELPGIPTPPDLPDGPLGIPGVVLDAYQFAQHTLAAIRPGCHLPWTVLAGIGRIESDHASDGRVDAYGNTLGPILGPRLDGSPGMAAIPDTDHGTLDGDTVWDRAVGPMQFIPSTWRVWGVDGNGDGVVSPNNIYDSTVSTGLYLCTGGTDLSDPAQLQAAVFRYNHSATYVNIVLEWAHAYLTGVVPTPSAPGPVPPGTNGNGGRLILPDSIPPAVVPPASVAQAVPLPPTPAPAPFPVPEPPSVPATTPPVTTTQPPPTSSPAPTTTTTTTPTGTPSPDIPSSSPSPQPPTTTSSAPALSTSPSPLPVSSTTSIVPSPVPTPSPTTSPPPSTSKP